MFTRLLIGIIVDVAGGAFVATLIGNSFPAEPVVGAGGLIGGVIAVLIGAFDWLAGPPPKKKGS